MSKTVTFHGGPMDGEIQAIYGDDQQVYNCFVNMGSWVSKHTYKEALTNTPIFEHYCAEYRFVVETDQPDEQGTIINLGGIEIRGTIPVCLNFGRHIKDIIGHGNVGISGGKLWCQAELRNEHIDLYPAIGFEVIKWEKRPTGKYYDSIKLFSIGLCIAPNLNPTIKTVREQIQTKP